MERIRDASFANIIVMKGIVMDMIKSEKNCVRRLLYMSYAT